MHLPCPCGRTLRARPDQAGTSIRCWGCGKDVFVPRPRVGTKLAGGFTRSLIESLSPELFFRAVGCGLVLSLLLMTPRAGRWLGLVSALIAAVLYQELIRSAGEEPHGEDVGISSLYRKGWFRRWLLAGLGVGALFAPLFFRNWGHLLPSEPISQLQHTLMIASFAGWLVVPLILFFANAHDGAGKLTFSQTLAIVAKHPWATITTLLVMPLGFCFIETFLAFFAWYENLLPLFSRDLYPMSVGTVETFPQFLNAFKNGYFLTGTLPESLAMGMVTRVEPLSFNRSREEYFIARFIFSVLTLASTGTVLAVQAYWFGLIGSIGSSRPTLVHPDTASVSPSTTTESPADTTEKTPVAVESTTAAAASPPALPAAATAAILHPVPFIGIPSSTSSPESNGLGMNSFVAGRSTILIVDDERAFAHAIGKIFADRGYAVVVAGDGDEGLRLAASCKPDLIILDLLLPDRPGMEVCQILRSQEATRYTPVVVASYKSGTVDEVGALTQGADDFVGKPYAIEVLIARVEKQLERQKARIV